MREQKTLLTKGLDRCPCRTGAPKRAEELPDTFLDTSVGIQAHARSGVIDKADGQPHLQFSATRLIKDPAAQPCPHDVQLSLAHRALQAEQQSIIEMCGIVDAILVKNQAVG